MVSVTVSAVRPIGAGTARGVTATGTKAAADGMGFGSRLLRLAECPQSSRLRR